MQPNNINELEKLLAEQGEQYKESEKKILKMKRHFFRWAGVIVVMIIISGCWWGTIFNKAIYGMYVKSCHPSAWPWLDRLEDAVALPIMNVFTALMVGMVAFLYIKDLLFFKDPNNPK